MAVDGAGLTDGECERLGAALTPGQMRAVGSRATLAGLREFVAGWAAANLGRVRYFCLNAVSDVPGCPDTQLAFTPDPEEEFHGTPSPSGSYVGG